MMASPSLAELEQSAAIVYRHMPPTPQYRWPLLCERTGADLWLKHENHTPVGAFKLRGGLVYFHHLAKVPGVVAATRGNHGQSVAYCAREYRLPATIVVPQGNSAEKNAAMRARMRHRSASAGRSRCRWRRALPTAWRCARPIRQRWS